MNLLTFLFWLTLPWLVMTPAWAGVAAIDVSQARGHGDQMEIETARAPDLGPQALAHPGPPPPGLEWIKRPVGIRTIGFEYAGIWAHAMLRNTSDRPRLGWVLVTESFTDHIDCFVSSGDTEEMVYRLGDRRPFKDRPIAQPGMLIPVNVFPDSTVHLHCLLRNNGSTAATFRYWDPEQYKAMAWQAAFSRALCYGALGFTVFVSLVLACINRSLVAFLMVAELLPVLLATSGWTGDAHQLLWPDHPELNLPSYYWILIAAVFTSLAFRAVLRLTRGEDHLFKLTVALASVLLLAVTQLPRHAPAISVFVQLMGVCFPIMLVWVCARHWQDDAVAKLLCVGGVVHLVGLSVNVAGVLGVYNGYLGLTVLYASVVKAVALAGALLHRMKLDRQERARALAEHNQELERRLAFEAQLRHAVSHHPRYGMPNQAMLEEAVRGSLQHTPQAWQIWVIKLNRFGFLESILPPDTLTALVKIYVAELKLWFADRQHTPLLTIEGEHQIAALDDSTLALLSQGSVSEALMADLERFLTRRFEWQGLFVAWDPHVGVAPLRALQDGDKGSYTDEARIALQWCSAHCRVRRFDADRMKREQLAYGLTLDLEGAIERGELLLHYQPKVTLRSRCTESLEALVRWHHPQRGMIPPGAFIAEAEATGAINRLTMWAIGEAARFLLTLPDSRVRVSVNITAFDLATPDFVDKVLATLQAEGCPPSRLILEVTESAALSDRDRATQILSRLRGEGIKIALDDFGTGYSSLGILQEMPLDEMKVDRSFVTDIAEFGRKQAVLQAMIEVGHRLGLTVTIEGVEHEASVSWLARHGCDVVQGFVFSRPLDANAARHWLGQALSEGSQPPELALAATPAQT